MQENVSAVLFEVIPGLGGNLGLITLNRPQALNALNNAMILALIQQLTTWESDPQIKAVVIQAAPGRAFCAGGDVRHAYELSVAHSPEVSTFFGDEYRLNTLIHLYKKPYIALLDGLTLGGGAGISIHGSHCIGTKNLVFAMPEVNIGFFPDVGASYFLPRFPGKTGYYLALTGEKISAADCLYVGVIKQLVATDCFIDLIGQLAKTKFAADAKTTITEIIQQFSHPATPAPLAQHRSAIDICFSLPSVEAILAALANSQDAWQQQIAANIQTKCPTSLKVSLRALQIGLDTDFINCMRMEYRLASRLLTRPDFQEGIRAALIDKDQSPHWHPNRLEDVTEESVASYFAPLLRQ